MKVAYLEDPAIDITVNLIKAWDRGELQPVTGSSGLKDYTKNHVWAIFDQMPEIVRIMMVRGEYLQSIPFLLVIDRAGKVFDMAAKEVTIQP
jgi:hypothetical protein